MKNFSLFVNIILMITTFFLVWQNQIFRELNIDSVERTEIAIEGWRRSNVTAKELHGYCKEYINDVTLFNSFVRPLRMKQDRYAQLEFVYRSRDPKKAREYAHLSDLIENKISLIYNDKYTLKK
ncbi:hypothetical protein N9933_01040 [bacterium]|nr:hypothetical protein [bacterium]